MPSQICTVAACGKKALDDIACAAVSAAAVSQYAEIVELIRQYTCIDINAFFGYIAYLVVLCWVGQWLNEIINFCLHTLPKFCKNLIHGKINLCLLDCGESEKSEHSEHSEESECDSLSFLH